MKLIAMPVSYTIRDLHRFWGKFERSGPQDCWPWTGAKCKSTDGYGSLICVRGRFVLAGRVYVASRVAYYFEYKEDPGELLVCHDCNNPLCVNPGHLFLGTYVENQQHCKDSGRRSDCDSKASRKLEVGNLQSRTGAEGVSFCSYYNRWRAQINVNGVVTRIGMFDQFEEAVAARGAAEERVRKWR